MKQQFYHHLLELEELLNELHQLKLAPAEKEHLITIIYSSAHTVVIDVILSEVPAEDKKLFLHHVHNSSHRDIWKFVKKRTVNIEDKIRKAIKELKKDLMEDIREIK